MSASNRYRWLLVVLWILAPMNAWAQQSATERQELWQDSDTWTLIAPADLKPDPAMLVGLRAIYHREESLLSDPLVEEAGFQFDRGWLKGEPILIARFHTSGDRARPESGPSSWMILLDPTSMESLGLMSSNSRWGSLVTRKTETGTLKWRLGVDETDWADGGSIEAHEPMIALSVWGHVLGTMRLQDGMKFRLQAFRSWIGPAFRVAGRTEFEDTQGRPHGVWAVETNMGSGWIGITYVKDEAPFFMGFEMRHAESGDVKIRWRLKSFQRLAG